MKRTIKFIILIFILMPVVVKAEVSLEEMHNLISTDNKLEIKSIPLEYYKNSNYYNSCVKEYSTWDDDAQNTCLNLVYEKLVTSYIYKNYDFAKEVISYAECNAKNNTCDIFISLDKDSENALKESYEIKFVGEYNKEVYNTVKNSMNNFKKSYSIDDMGYINQLINYDDIEKYFGLVQGNVELFKMYPEMKKYIESNSNIKYIPVFGAGGWGPLSLDAGGVLVAYYDDIAVGMSENFTYSTYRIIYISNKTENTTEAYIDAALKRIKEYINDNSYKISITYDEETEDGDYNYLEYETKIYKLTINDKEYNLGISPMDEEKIKKLKIESKDYKTDISVETESFDVPLDVSVKAEDLTNKYKGYLKVYDINLYSSIKDEYVTKMKNGIIVRIPLPDEYNKKSLDIYYIKENGEKGEKYEAIVVEIDGKKYAVFTTNHFSIYAIEEINEDLEKNSEEIKNPQTNDGISNSRLLFILSVLCIMGIVFYLKRKEVN